MLRNALMCLAACLAAAALCLAQAQRITLKDGRIIEGEIVEKTDAAVKVKVKIGVLTFPSDQIESIEEVVDPKREYQNRLAKLSPTNVDGQVALGQWAVEQGFLKEARERFEAALKVNKNHERAALLLRDVQARIERAEREGRTEPTSGTAVPLPGDRSPFDAAVLLKDEDINQIRLCELRENETVSVEFRRDKEGRSVVDRFIARMEGREEFRQKGAVQQFRGLSPSRQARYMIAKLDRDDALKDDIIISSDPAFMREFRAYVWRNVYSTCAATQCHGAEKGQEIFKLYNYAGTNHYVDYTNFLIMDSLVSKQGYRVIDRDHPEDSLLLQYGLPPPQARLKHSKTIQPIYLSRTSPAYQRTLEWVRELEGPPHPAYQIRKLPPFVMPPGSGLPGLPGGTSPTSKPQTGAAKREIPF